ncbi:pyridoxamine 5'-phosphate oxidase family protein [Candidatus Binatia bacterium]|nr:pyridoxamine 5'-phosphate oxidase family protein [Candidatus Binatia bacterium]
MIDEVEAYIRERQSMVMAMALDDEVRASTACYAVGDDMNLYSLVFAGSVKHRGVLQQPTVSLVIDDGFRIPMRGVEIIGRAEVLTGEAREYGEALLSERFPALDCVRDDPRILIIRVTPERVRYTDWTFAIGRSRETKVVPLRGTERSRLAPA